MPVIIVESKNKIPENITTPPNPNNGLLNDEKTVLRAIKSKMTLYILDSPYFEAPNCLA